jgi:hypothetical protein
MNRNIFLMLLLPFPFVGWQRIGKRLRSGQPFFDLPDMPIE